MKQQRYTEFKIFKAVSLFALLCTSHAYLAYHSASAVRSEHVRTFSLIISGIKNECTEEGGLLMHKHPFLGFQDSESDLLNDWSLIYKT